MAWVGEGEALPVVPPGTIGSRAVQAPQPRAVGAQKRINQGAAGAGWGARASRRDRARSPRTETGSPTMRARGRSAEDGHPKRGVEEGERALRTGNKKGDVHLLLVPVGGFGLGGTLNLLVLRSVALGRRRSPLCPAEEPARRPLALSRAEARHTAFPHKEAASAAREEQPSKDTVPMCVCFRPGTRSGVLRARRAGGAGGGGREHPSIACLAHAHRLAGPPSDR